MIVEAVSVRPFRHARRSVGPLRVGAVSVEAVSGGAVLVMSYFGAVWVEAVSEWGRFDQLPITFLTKYVEFVFICIHVKKLVYNAIWQLIIRAADPEIGVGGDFRAVPESCSASTWQRWCQASPREPTLWRGVPVAHIQKSFRSSERD